MAYELLPKEILLEIFSYLNVADLLISACVCRHWYAVSLDPSLSEKVVFVLREDASVGMTVLKNSCRPVRHLVLKEVDLGSDGISFWKCIGPSLTHLDFHSCDIAERLFVEILSSCLNLRTLNIVGCNSLFISGTLFEKCMDLETPCIIVPTVRELSVASNRYLSDALLQRLLRVLPRVEKFSLESCQLTFHPGIFKRFYPPWKQHEHLSGAVLTFQVITSLLEESPRKINSFNLSRTLVDNTSLKKLITMQSFLLEELHLVSCEQLTHAGIQFLCENLPNLKVLDLSSCYQLSDQSVACICQNLQRLRSLRLRRCHNLTDESIRQIASLTGLKELDLSSCEKVSPTAFGVALAPLGNLNQLNLSYCHVAEDILDRHMRNLRFLDLSYCLAVSDETLQLILSYVQSLRHLRLAWCKEITNRGLCGWDDPVAITEKFDLPVVLCGRMPRPVYDYTPDVKPLKRCSTSKSLSHLKCLRHLDLCGCVNVGNLGLSMGIRNVELQYLNLSLCNQLTDRGLVSISCQNPSLETLILSQCYQLTDDGVISALQKLRRLKYLDLQGCRQLTNGTLRGISRCSRGLRYLNVTLCPLMNSDAVANLEIELLNLHTVYK